MADAGLALDPFQQIVNVHWGGGEQQGLLAEYPPGPGAPTFENIGEVMSGRPTAYAIDSGQSFEGVNMGASGSGFTVLTAGLVCFGKPRNGDACFIACPGYKYPYNVDDGDDSLLRGTVTEGVLTWEPTTAGGSGKLVALSFAWNAFFAVYVDFDDPTAAGTIATSFDGQTWSTGSAFPPSGEFGAVGGAVAATVKIVEVDGEETEQITYVAAGQIAQDSSSIRNSVANLMWATSSNGLTWSSGSNEGVMAEPGTWFDLIGNYSSTIGGGSVSKDKQMFMAPAGTKTLIPNPIDPEFPYAMLTSAPAVSETGTDWTVTAVGLAPGLNQISFGLAAIYCRNKDKTGFFLMSDHEYYTGDAIPAANSTLYKSSDGLTWSSIRTNTNWMATLSAIARDLTKTEIVHI